MNNMETPHGLGGSVDNKNDSMKIPEISETDIISSYEELNITYKDTLALVNTALDKSKKALPHQPFIQGSLPHTEPVIKNNNIHTERNNIHTEPVIKNNEISHIDNTEYNEPGTNDEIPPINIPLINIPLINIDIKDESGSSGELYQLCPCQPDLICHQGVCKKPSHSVCLISSECAGNSICYEGYCTPRPGKWETPINNKCQSGLTIAHDHLVILRNNEFVLPPGWMAFENSFSICSGNNMRKKIGNNTGNNKNSWIILSNEELYQVNISDKLKINVINEISRPFNTLEQNSLLFNYDNDIFFLSGTTLYVMEWLKGSPGNHSMKSKVEWINFNQYDDDIFSMSEDQSIQLEDGTHVIKKSKKYYHNDDYLRTVIRNSLITHSMENHSVGDQSDENHNGISLTKNIKMIVRDPTNDTLIVLNRDETLYRYDYETGDIFKLRGKGHKLIMCNNEFWLLTNGKCIEL